MATTARFFILLLATAVVNGFPLINYTGQSCTPGSAQVSQRCISDKTSITFSSKSTNAFNGTHALVFLGEPFEITCCTPPKSNSSSSISATLSQRTISYVLHSGSPAAELPVLRGNQVNAKLAAFDIAGNNNMCEYSTVYIWKATYSEAGKWKCAAYDSDTPGAELQVIVGEKGQVETLYFDVTKVPEPYMYFSLAVNDYAPAGAKIDFTVGTNESILVPLTSNGIYGNGSISIAGLERAVEQIGTTCATETNAYDVAAGGNYVMNICRNTMVTSFNVTRLSSLPDILYLYLSASTEVGWRRTSSQRSITAKLLLKYYAPTKVARKSKVAANQGVNASNRYEGGLLLIFVNIFFTAMLSFLQQ